MKPQRWKLSPLKANLITAGWGQGMPWLRTAQIANVTTMNTSKTPNNIGTEGMSY
jgi:hypothetical protein